jgi:hypothetical protein
MLSGRRKKDYATESAADALAAQADAMGLEPVDEAGYAASAAAVSDDTDDELEDAELEAAAA